MKEAIRILIVEDKPSDAELAKYTIQKVLKDCEFQIVETRKDFLNALEVFQPDVILSDYSLPRFDGMKALKLVLEHAPLTPLIIWTGSISEDVAVECMKAGANNYVLKENIKRLAPAVIHALEERQLLLERKQAEDELRASQVRFHTFVDHASDAFYLHDERGTILNVNRQAYESLGYTREELIGMTPFDFDVDVKPSFIEQVGAKLANGELVTFDTRHRRKDGTVFPVEVRIRSFREGGQRFGVSLVRDISERKQAEEALQNNEKRFRALIENGLDNISLLAADGTLIWESPATFRTLDYAPDEFVGHNIFELIHPDDLEWTRDQFVKLIQEPGSRQRGIFRLHRSDSTWRWVEAIATNMLNEPSVNAIVINYRDITERQQAEEALRQSQLKYQNLVETSHDLIWSVDAKGQFTFVNRAAKEIYGYEPEELIGRSFFEIMDPEHYHMDLEEFKESIADADEFRDLERHVRHRDGRQIILSSNSIVMRDDHGDIIGVTGSSHDITERKKIEDVLKEERNLLRTLIDNIPDRIYAMDIQGRKTLSNTADWKASGGKTMEDVIGKTDFDTYPPELAEGFWQLNQAVLDSGQPVINYEELGLDNEGKRVSILTTKVPLRDSEGKVIGLVGIGRDITERKRAEEALHDSESKYRTLAENSLQGIAIYQGQKIVYANPAMCLINGYTAEELMDMSADQIVALTHPDDRTIAQERARKRMAGETISPEVELRIVRKDGTTAWLQSFNTPIEYDRQPALLSTMIDITDRKQAEEKLRESENRLILALAGAQMSVWEWNLQTNTIFWSPELFEITGVTRDDLDETFESFTTLIHQEDVNRVRAAAEKALADQSLFAEEFRIIRPDGKIRWLSNLGHAEYDLDRKNVRLIGTIQNITPRKQAEIERQALLEIMQRLANTKDLQELLKLVHHSIAKVIYAENFFVVLYQQSSGQFEEIYSVDQYDPPASPSKLEKSITSYVFRSGEPLLLTQERFNELAAQGEVELIGTNSASWLGVPLKTSGKTIGVIAVQDYENSERYSERDKDFLASIATQVALAIERKQAEDALHKSEALYRQAIEVAGAVPYYESYYDEGRSIKYEFIGEGIRQITGYGPEEFSAKLWDSLVEEVNLVEDLAGYSLDDGIQRVRAGETSIWKCEHRLRDRDGNIHWVFEAAVELRDENGVSHGSIGTYQDITARKQAEAAEREQRALAEALRDTAETLSSTLDYGEVLDHILAAVGRVVPHDAATIMLIEGESARVVRSYGYDKRGFDFEIMGIRLPLAETDNLRQMLETRQPVIVYDTHSYPGWMRVEATDWLRSNVGAPISIHGNTIGFILLDSQALGFFTPVHAERLEAFANQAALAIQNARLLQQAEEEITERKQAEKELRTSEERFRQLADNIKEAFWMTDAQTGQEIYMSPAVEAIWERPIENLMYGHNTYINSVLPEDQSAVLQAIEREKNGEKVEIEYRIIRPNGSIRWVWDRAFPIFDDTGKVKRIAGLTADITERRESEIALIKSRSRYRELFDSSPISMWEEDYSLVKQQIDLLLESGVTDLKEYLSTHPDKVTELASLVKITDVNKAALELYNIEQKELVPEELTQILSRDALNHFQEEILGFMSPSKRFIWEGTDRRVNGTQIEVIVNGSIPQGYEEDWSKVIVSVSNITERKQAEKEIRRRAEETSALLATSLALTSLDLQATLQDISNSAKTLFAADGCRIFLVEPDGEFLRCVLALQENSEAFSDLKIKIGDGVTGAVAASGQAEIVNTMQNDPRGVQVPGTLDEEEEAIMFAPLKERDRTIGVLSIRRIGTERPFQPADLELLEALASMAASAVSNARLFEETQRRLAELEALYENGLAVGRLLEPWEIGERIIETFTRHLSWHHVTIRLKQPESDELELIAFNQPGLSDEEKNEIEHHFNAMISRVGQGMSGWVIHTGLPLRTGNVHVHPQYIDTHVGIQSGLYMPLKVGERVIGVISVESEMPEAFTEQDERLLATLASQAAIAFENARLYQAIEQELVERKRAEEALRTSETHYRELADSITDILFELDQDLHYTHWNKASEALTGISVKDAIGKPMHEIFGESEEQTRISQIYEGVLKNRQPRTFETILLLNEQKRSFEINAYPSTRGVSVVAKDVTERKRSEIIMQKRFELMEFSAHHTLDELMQKTTDEVSELTGSSIGFFHFVDEDHITLKMQTWSTHALQLFHVPVSEGAHLPLDQAGVWAEAARQRRPLIQNDYESLSKKRGLPQGHVPITREMIIPIIRNERIMAIMGIGNKSQDYTQSDLEIAERLADYAWDVTERKQMEMALEAERNQLAQRVDERTADLSRANSNLARALRVKDEFLANMSHELRTPLNAILGLSESLGEQIAGPLNEKQQKYIATIGESGHHLLSLINDILDLAKIDAGQITLDINKVDVHSVCQASLRMIKQLAQKKNQDVSLEIEDSLKLMWADERRLKQMLVNLLGNAVKFTPENGRLGLEVYGDEEANKISFTVWDEGVGIREEDLARLFQPFVQLDSGLARETTGTGLGLALVAQMARLHGGSIAAFSEPERGSRFTILLPWEPALAMEAATRMKITGKFRAIKLEEKNKPVILLVEDTREVTMMVKDYLELAGYKIVTAQDGVDAIVQAKLVRPDLILMDVQMPRMDGLEATRKLRSEPDFRYTPIIALTALAMSGDRERCLEAGMDEYISKPINLKALIKIIQECLFSNQEAKSQ